MIFLVCAELCSTLMLLDLVKGKACGFFLLKLCPHVLFQDPCLTSMSLMRKNLVKQTKTKQELKEIHTHTHISRYTDHPVLAGSPINTGKPWYSVGGAEFCCLHVLAEGIWYIWFRQKMLEISLTVLLNCICMKHLEKSRLHTLKRILLLCFWLNNEILYKCILYIFLVYVCDAVSLLSYF